MSIDTMRRISWRTPAVVGAAIAAAALAPAVAQAGKPTDPEQKRFPPSAHAGFFVGTPYPTYKWHGCSATASQQTLAALKDPIPGLKPNIKGTKQRAVHFTRTVGPPYLSWKVRKGWTICGVQAMAELITPDVDHGLAAEVGYPSGRSSGSTAPDGKETLLVKVPKKGPEFYSGDIIEPFMGKTLSIQAVRDVTVFVRRARK